MVEIDKKTGRCKIIKKRNGDPENKLAYRVMWVLMRDWRNNKLLDVTQRVG